MKMTCMSGGETGAASEVVRLYELCRLIVVANIHEVTVYMLRIQKENMFVLRAFGFVIGDVKRWPHITNDKPYSSTALRHAVACSKSSSLEDLDW